MQWTSHRCRWKSTNIRDTSLSGAKCDQFVSMKVASSSGVDQFVLGPLNARIPVVAAIQFGPWPMVTFGVKWFAFQFKWACTYTFNKSFHTRSALHQIGIRWCNGSNSDEQCDKSTRESEAMNRREHRPAAKKIRKQSVSHHSSRQTKASEG